MKVFVIGGTRFIGPATVSKLLARGHQVALFNRGQTSSTVPEGVTRFVGDRNDVDKLAAAVAEFEPDVVLDMCSYFVKHQDALEAATKGRALKTVMVSSCDVYRNYGGIHGKESGPPDPVPIPEDGPLRTKPYPYRDLPGIRPGLEDYDKIPNERRVLVGGGVVVRLPMVYGPGDYQHRLFPYLRRMDAGRPHIVLGEAETQWMTCRAHVENVAEALRFAVESGEPGEAYNVAEQPAVPEGEWVAKVAEAAGWKGRLVVVPDASVPESIQTVDRPEWHLATDSTKIRERLGYREVVGFAEGLRATVEWERANPPESPPEFDAAAEDAVVAASIA